MKERISKLIQHFGLTSSRLAEILGVQRSGISHILSGRNNPGYDFLVKLLEEFPSIDANWLLLGKGSMLTEKDETNISGLIEEENKSTVNTGVSGDFSLPFDSEKDDRASLQINEGYKSKQVLNQGSRLDKVILLFSDGSFQEYGKAAE